jgi:hypothetical protein
VKGLKPTFITAIAIGLLAGSTVGVTAQEEEAASEAPTGTSFFTGTYEPAPEPTVEGTVSEFDDVEQVRDMLLEDSIDTSDPRVSGTVSRTVNADFHTLSDVGQVAYWTHAWRIANEGGTWTGPGTGLSDSGSPTRAFFDTDTLLLTGEGGYAGLTAYLDLDWTQDPVVVTGAVFAGEAPPFPEPPAE